MVVPDGLESKAKLENQYGMLLIKVVAPRNVPSDSRKGIRVAETVVEVIFAHEGFFMRFREGLFDEERGARIAMDGEVAISTGAIAYRDVCRGDEVGLETANFDEIWQELRGGKIQGSKSECVSEVWIRAIERRSGL